MPDRILNYLYGFILIVFYVALSPSGDQTRMMIALILALSISLFALFMNWLSLDGVFAALVIGTVALGLGGLPAALALVLFFLSSYFIGFVLGNNEVENYQPVERRTGSQVWANAFWFVLFITLGYYFRDEVFRIAAIGSLAVAMADTWATEMGTRTKNVRTYFILNFKRVETGVDGGISLVGTFGGFLGGLLLAITYVLISHYHSLMVFWIIGAAGFLGCILDSYLGAIFQTRDRKFPFMKSFSLSGKLDNNGVNVISTGLGGIFTICMLWLA